MTNVKVTVVVTPRDKYSGVRADKIKTTFKSVWDQLKDPTGKSENFYTSKEF